MTASDQDAVLRRLAGCRDLLRRVQAALPADDPRLLQDLAGELERLRTSIAPLGPLAMDSERNGLLALLDEAGRVRDALEAARDQTRAGLRDVGARRRAGTAYHLAGRLGSQGTP